MEVELPFANRREAGRALGAALRGTYVGQEDTLILALVRGGVAIGRSLVDDLHLPLHPYIVRKIGHPRHREFAVGAIAEGGATHMDENVIQAFGVEWNELESVIEEEIEEMKRRRNVYRSAPLPPLAGTTVILTDDGAATGATLLAAIADLRKAKAKRIVVALPVCPPDTAAVLRKAADELVTLATPVPFNAVGEWYLEFPQLEDSEVLELLKPAT